MYNQEKMQTAMRRFDWNGVSALLHERTDEILTRFLTDINRSACLIRLHDISVEENQLRAQFIDHLKQFTSEGGGASATVALDHILEQVELTELALAEIDSTFRSDDFAKHPPATQAWAILSWASREIVEIYAQLDSAFKALPAGSTVVIDPLTVRLDKEHGQGLAAGRINQISHTTANTLRMLGHRNRWFANGRFQLPAQQQVTEKEIDSAARIARLGDVWETIVDESKMHRYWGGHFRVEPPDAEQLQVLPGIKAVLRSATTEAERRDDAQIFEHISHIRLQRISFAAVQKISHSNARDRIGNPRQVQVALPPTELVSELELATLYVLQTHFYFDPLRNKTSFGGLTILEWVRGYCVLQHCYTTDGSGALLGLVKLDPVELRETLIRAGFSADKAEVFLQRVTFQPGRRDLYDAPLLLSTDGNTFFFAALYHGVDISLLIASQIGTQKRNVDNKGTAFEKAILSLFQKAGIDARSFKFTIGDTGYQCDVAVLWDKCLFIFECKNYGLPNDDPADRFFFWQKQIDAAEQVRRIANDLSSHPELIKRHFGLDAAWDSVYPVVLNAFPLSLPKSPSGGFFYDGSALHRFLDNGTLNFIHATRREGALEETSFVVKQLWTGHAPSSADLIREMENPTQVSIQWDEYYLARKLLPLSTTSAIYVHRVASKPPDFEELQTNE